MAIESAQVNKALFDGLVELIPSLRGRCIVALSLRLNLHDVPTLELTERVTPCAVAPRHLLHPTKTTVETVTTRFTLVELKAKEAPNGG